MVLGRTPKQYKHFMRSILTALVTHESIITTAATAKHLTKAGHKLIHFAKKAVAGQTSPLNLLRGRVGTDAAKKKLMEKIVPMVKDVKQNMVLSTGHLKRRKGDNAPVVRVWIRGSEVHNEKMKEYYEQKHRVQPAMPLCPSHTQKNEFSKRLLLQEKEYYEKCILEQPALATFLASKIARVEFELWTFEKKYKERYERILLI